MPFKSKERLAEYRREYTQLTKSAINELKESVPCKDCEQYYPHYMMEFDHVRGVKEFNVSGMGGRSFNNVTLQKEISKCDIVCANCHSARTHFRRMAD